jgi:molecular chaperone GrpE
MQENKSNHENEEEFVLEEDSEYASSKSNDAVSEVKKLKEKIKQLEAEKLEYLTGWQKSKADYINSNKRAEEEKKDLTKYLNRDLILDILPVLDSFDMAMANKESWEATPKNWRLGVEYIYSQLLSALGNYGLSQNNPAGEKFNPELHEAVGVVNTDNHDDESTIAEVVGKGYKLHDTTLRGAKVKIYQVNK